MSGEDFRAHITGVDGPPTALLQRWAEALFTQQRCLQPGPHHPPARGPTGARHRRPDGQPELRAHTAIPRPDAGRAPHLGQRGRPVLAEDGCISRTRCRISITDRPRLRAHACNCFLSGGMRARHDLRFGREIVHQARRGTGAIMQMRGSRQRPHLRTEPEARAGRTSLAGLPRQPLCMTQVAVEPAQRIGVITGYAIL
jgi:hypothetical protein